MFGKDKDAEYRREVEGQMDYLLGYAHPQVFASIFQEFPGTLAVAQRWRIEGRQPLFGATSLLTSLLASLVEKSVNPSQKDLFEGFILRGDGVAKSEVYDVVRRFLANVTYEVKAGHIDEVLAQFAFSEVIWAAEGLLADQRQSRREQETLWRFFDQSKETKR